MTKVVGEFSEFERVHLDRLDNDDLKEQVAELFADACQKNPYSEEQLERIYRDGQLRHLRGNIPPISAKDMKRKEVPNCYGDLVAWQAIMSYANKNLQETKRTMVLVTEDKDWLDGDDRPRPELVREMHAMAGVRFFACKTKRFRMHSELYLNIKASQGAKQEDEIREKYIAEQEELARQIAETARRAIEAVRRTPIEAMEAVRRAPIEAMEALRLDAN